jgi:hypothetical protein
MAQKNAPLTALLKETGKTPAKDASREDKTAARKAAKKALAAKLAPLLERPEGEEPDHFEKRLTLVSNKKLLNLLHTQDRLKKEFGTKANLVEAIAAHQKRSKDADYQKKLATLSVGRLLTLAPKKAAN